jgi:biotin transport system substrate-specific component
MKKQKLLITATDIAECGLFVAIMCIFTLFVKIPFYPVPLTFQTVISVLAGLLLGWKNGAISMAVYCIMGLIGIPVFSDSSAGITYVLQPSFGYILGFIASAAVAGFIAGRAKLPLWRYIVAALSAFLVNYIIGIPYFMLIWQFYLKSGNLWHYVVMYNLLYMPKDAVLSVIAAFVAYGVLPAISKGRAKLNTKDKQKLNQNQEQQNKPL